MTGKIYTEALPLFDWTSESKYGVGTYYNADKNQMDRFGPIYLSDCFDKFLICDGFQLFFFPAETRDEAVSIAVGLTGDEGYS